MRNFNSTPEAGKIVKENLDKYKEFEFESKWYLSHCYMRQGKTKEVKKLQSELAEGNSDYSSEARKVLNKCDP